MNKVSIRFFQNREIRAVWDESSCNWWFSVVDLIAAINSTGRLYSEPQLLEISEDKTEQREI